MKNLKSGIFPLIIAVSVLFSFSNIPAGGSIIGRITPPDGATRAWALSAKDTLRATISNAGAFEIPNAEAGVYTVVVEAKPPFKNQARENVNVTDGKPTDIGEIRLEQ